MADDEMTYPKIISGVWVTGFEESSFFAGDTVIPDRNDPRRYREELIDGRKLFDKVHDRYAKPGYSAFHITFFGRRTKYPYMIDCEGGRYYSFLPDWVLRIRYLGPIADPDRPVRQPGPYQPFKRSGERGVIKELEDEAFARCGGTHRAQR